MLPGKKYNPEDFLRMAWTRKWFILIPTLLAGLGTAVWSYTLPNRYSSTTTILVVPQRVPENLVRSTVTASVSERLQTISQQILSRTRLERIIEEFNLYRRERETMIMEDIIERMRRQDIRIEPARASRRDDATHFTVGFVSDNPRTAMQVTERIASMFVQENLQDREILADSTNQFLQAQLEDARRRLLEHEAKLQGFKQQYAGQLPTQAQSNLQMMQMTQTQIQSNVEEATRERDRIATLETAIADLLANSTRVVVPASNDAPATAAQQLEAARGQLRLMEQRLKPNHPDIARAKRILADLERKAEEEAARLTPLATGEAAAVPPPAVATRINGMRAEIENLRRSLENRKAEDDRLRNVMSTYAVKVESAPKLEAELTELMRDYNTIQEQYTSLLRKSEESKIAVNLERRQIGEQFKVIDGARLPERPFSPDRLRMNLLGLVGGLAFGVLLAALLEYRDTTLKTDDDIVTSLALPALAVIPRMISSVEAKRHRRRRLLISLSAASVVVLMIAGAAAAWRYDLLDNLVR
jgi:polysaccharide chain length determinant protein (PEP-CTERM system associated)